ncbi:MAG TPA: glycosyltransferase, partial [Actinomycetota bacterium]|nr:glycosyltransferase [Actinomycetota bacterium]
ALLESSNVVCLPAIGGESFGYTLVEAMAAGRAVVASAIPGYASVARDGLEAVLVPPGRPEAVAGALARLLAAPHEAAAMGAAARARAKTYDWPVVAGDIEEVYREALDRAAPSRTRRIAVKRRAGRTL